jgi:hypothetical protein
MSMRPWRTTSFRIEVKQKLEPRRTTSFRTEANQMLGPQRMALFRTEVNQRLVHPSLSSFSLSLSVHSVTKKKTYAMIKRRRVIVVEGKTGRPNPKQSREVHVGRNPSNLTAKLTLGLTLQVFKTS